MHQIPTTNLFLDGDVALYITPNIHDRVAAIEKMALN